MKMPSNTSLDEVMDTNENKVWTFESSGTNFPSKQDGATYVHDKDKIDHYIYRRNSSSF